MVVSFVSKKWCTIHRLTIKPNSRVAITFASEKALDIVGTTSVMVILVPTLESDLEKEVVSLGDFKYFLIGMDVISGLRGVTRPVQIRFLGARIKDMCIRSSIVQVA